MANDEFDTYRKHFERMRNQPPDWAEAERDPSRFAARMPWLPTDHNAVILDFGCGWGSALMSLWCAGYRNLTGIDVSQSQVSLAQEACGGRVAIHCVDGREYLAERSGEYDMITLYDVLEHIDRDSSLPVLRTLHRALKPGGKLVVRVPNMSCLLASYSRYLDWTHVVGFTEFSLVQLLELAGFDDCIFEIAKPDFRVWRPWCPWRGLGLRHMSNRALHWFVYKLRGQTPRPQCIGMNLTVCAIKR